VPVVVLVLLAAHDAPVFAQPSAKLPTERAPCLTPNPTDPKEPCVTPAASAGPAAPNVPTGAGSGAGSAGGAAGSGGGQNSAPAEALGPYRVVKVTDRAGETLDGIVCAIDKPFVVRMRTRPAAFDIAFEPADKTHGTWTYAYDIPTAGESHRAHGDHTVSPATADGTRSLTIDGPDFVTFRGFAGRIQMHYVMGFAPIADGGGCGR
jgi:hypothetical protein